MNQFDLFREAKIAGQPFVVCDGVGVDSTGLEVGLYKLGIRPDLILFADVGAERQSTLDYIPIKNAWLRSIGFPEITVVRYQCQDFKHWPPYHSLEENCLTNGTLPSIAYGTHRCSSKWKIAPQCKFIEAWERARWAWDNGLKVVKAIGFDASPREQKRSHGCSTYAVQEEEADKYEIIFPLQEWGWDRKRCIQEIKSVGLPVPTKSSCYFCTAMKPWEVDELPVDKLKRILVIERRANRKHLEYAERKGWPKGIGVSMTEGIWRKRVKGMRGAIAKPGSMTEYIREKGLLPSEEIDRIVNITPTEPLVAGQIVSWQHWLKSITE